MHDFKQALKIVLDSECKKNTQGVDEMLKEHEIGKLQYFEYLGHDGNSSRGIMEDANWYIYVVFFMS